MLWLHPKELSVFFASLLLCASLTGCSQTGALKPQASTSTQQDASTSQAQSTVTSTTQRVYTTQRQGDSSRQPHAATTTQPGNTAPQAQTPDSLPTSLSAIYRVSPSTPGPLTPLSFDELIGELANADVILLGEKHDERRHHQAQLAILQALHQRRQIGSVVLEMLPSSSQQAFRQGQLNIQTQLSQSSSISSSDIKDTLHWPEKWEWQQYAPLIAWLLRNHIPMYGANLNDDELAVIAQGSQPLRGNVSIQPQVRSRIADLVRNHHVSSDAQLDAMVTAQQFRDRRMAETLVKNAKPAVLLAGNVHTDGTIGVPLHLQDYGQHHVASVMLLRSPQEANTASADYFLIIR